MRKFQLIMELISLIVTVILVIGMLVFAIWTMDNANKYTENYQQYEQTLEISPNDYK